MNARESYNYFAPKNLPTTIVIGRDLFFFSSRRRHTRCLSDWSSDVCSSDLVVFRTLAKGDHVVAGENMYGGSYRLFSRVLEKFGLEFSYVDTSKVDAVRAA